MDHVSYVQQALESSRLTTGHVWAASRTALSSKGRLTEEKQDFKYTLRDPALTIFPECKLTSYQQVPIKHFYVTNIEVSSYGIHSLKQILHCSPTTKRKLLKSNMVSKKGDRKNSFCMESALGQTR